MDTYYCNSCGKKIFPEDISSGSAAVSESSAYCPECVAAASDSVKIAEIRKDSRCTKCGANIPSKDIMTGNAVITDDAAYCVRCVAAVMPLFEALKEKEKVEIVQPVIKKTPVHGTGIPRSGVERSQKYSQPEKKGCALILIVLFGISLLILFAALMLTS